VWEVRGGERCVGEEWAEGPALGGVLETACLLYWPWKGGGLCVGCGNQLLEPHRVTASLLMKLKKKRKKFVVFSKES
jgi:hypothetical protein